MISIIVPILNEEKNIQRLQKNLKALQGEFEVVFCDGGSTDRTLELIDPAFRVVNGRKGRGYQMNEGAKSATGDLLFFIHCDTVLEEDVLNKISLNVKTGKSVGYLRLEFDSASWLMKICAFMSGLRTSVRKIVYGDQGIIITRELLEQLGGIPQLPIMEDLEFSLRLKKQNIPLEQVRSKIITSSRRFEENGMFRTMQQMQKLQLKYLFGKNVELILNEYNDVR